MPNYQTQHGTKIAHETADADLLLRIGLALAARQRTAWRVVRVGARGGIVRLEGVVPTFYDRQLIVAVARHVAGVLRIEDELAIVEPPARQQEAVAEIAPVPSVHDGTEGKPKPAPNPFHHLPETESLEEILARWAQSAFAG
jgi:hypothetical protein